MQNAKDSFYLALRSRLLVCNPQRTVLVRGTLRPGILLEEAEAPFAQPPADVFVLRWGALGTETELPSAMVAMECEISYCTSGTQAFGGLDRGRSLGAMDQELISILQPLSTPKVNYSVQPAAPMPTLIFWEEPAFTSISVQRDRVSRSARVKVYSYQEQGE
jgi:hypothetical protein